MRIDDYQQYYRAVEWAPITVISLRLFNDEFNRRVVDQHPWYKQLLSDQFRAIEVEYSTMLMKLDARLSDKITKYDRVTSGGGALNFPVVVNMLFDDLCAEVEYVMETTLKTTRSQIGKTVSAMNGWEDDRIYDMLMITEDPYPL